MDIPVRAALWFLAGTIWGTALGAACLWLYAIVTTTAN